MIDRRSDRFTDDSGHMRDMTEETLGAQEQERQARQHRREAREQRGRQAEEHPSGQEDDDRP